MYAHGMLGDLRLKVTSPRAASCAIVGAWTTICVGHLAVPHEHHVSGKPALNVNHTPGSVDTASSPGSCGGSSTGPPRSLTNPPSKNGFVEQHS